MTPEQLAPASPLRQLTAQEFIDIITLKDEKLCSDFYQIENEIKSIIICNVEITEKIKITDGIIVSLPLTIDSGIFSYIHVNGGKFEGSFRIKGGNFNGKFKIDGGYFKELLIISGGDFEKDFVISGAIFQNGFWITGGIFKQHCWFMGGTFERHCLIKEATFKQNFQIADTVFNQGFWVESGIFEDGFWIEDATFRYNFIIAGGVFNKSFRIEGKTNFDNFNISGGTFQNDFIIYSGQFNNSTKISSGIFNEHFMILGGIFNDNFDVDGGTFNHTFGIYGGQFLKLFRIRPCDILRLYIGILSSRIFLITSEVSQINIITIEGIIVKESMIKISSKVYQLILKDVHNFGSIILNRFSFRDQLNNPNRLSSTNIEYPFRPELRIEDSDLGKMTIINSDLTKFGLHFDSSKITDVFVTGTKMPNQITTPDPKQKQLGYSQIKKIYEARGDRVEANRYYAREMEAYQTTLAWRNWDDFWEKLNLRLNKYSTNYGQSWQKGLGTTLLVSGAFYIIYCWCLGYLPALPTAKSLNLLGHVASYFLEFLNPIHKADYVAQELLKNKGQTSDSVIIPDLARGVEGFSRIFIAYFVYQLIQAFRKHGKASG